MRTTAAKNMRKDRGSARTAASPLRLNGRWSAVKGLLQERYVALAGIDLVYRVGEEERLIGAVQHALGTGRPGAIDVINKAADDARLADEMANPPADVQDADPAADEDLDTEPWDPEDEFNEPRKRYTSFED